MAYEPTEWQAGDTITSARLNKIEQGIADGGGAFVVDIIEEENGDERLSATGQEILDTLHEGKMVMAHKLATSSEYYVFAIYVDAESTGMTISLGGDNYSGSLSEYPVKDGK